MANKYRWTFDTTVVQEATNTLEMQESFAYDEELKFWYWEKTNRFNFIGDAYDYLHEKYTSGFCSEVAVTIDEDCNLDGLYAPFFKGIIKIRDVVFSAVNTVESNGNCVASATINDNNYFALINNNKSIEYLFGIGKTKNDETLAVAGTLNVLIDNPCTFSSTHTRQLFSIHNCIKEIIGHITDNRVDYDSPFFGTGGAKQYLMCGSGYQLRVDGWHSLFPLLGMKETYSALFTELDKKYDLGAYIDYSGTKPKIIIDLYDNFFLTTKSITVNNPVVVKLSTFFQKISSHVKIGGETFPQFDCPDDGEFPTETAYYGFKKEQFTLLNQCNIDKPLDLQGNYIVDHNILYQVIVKGIPDWDDRIFLLDCRLLSGSIQPELTDVFVDGRYFWNADLKNDKVAERWADQLPSSMAAYLQQTNYRFKAVRAFPPLNITNFAASTFPVDYAPLGFDPDNLYGNGTAQGFDVFNPNCIFTAPIDGYYLFKYHVPVNTQNVVANFIRKDFGGTTIQTINKTVITGGVPTNNINIYCSLYMTATDTMLLQIQSPTTMDNFGANAYLELISSPVISGVTQGVTQDLAKFLKIEIRTSMGRTDYSTMKFGFKNYVEVLSITKVFRGYLYASKYNENTGEANLILITSNSFLDGRN